MGPKACGLESILGALSTPAGDLVLPSHWYQSVPFSSPPLPHTRLGFSLPPFSLPWELQPCQGVGGHSTDDTRVHSLFQGTVLTGLSEGLDASANTGALSSLFFNNVNRHINTFVSITSQQRKFKRFTE